ncbi:MAG: hypothetical protein F2534_18040 [Actinobacteria bacterium]|uniref:Unannotated protein n=1 Tax=freshwater metagenome TaxID=449393 RepID=A0A6J6FIP3_9ZZZZ|nr:hypothetical protein [Actinomycetota bacterium]
MNSDPERGRGERPPSSADDRPAGCTADPVEDPTTGRTTDRTTDRTDDAAEVQLPPGWTRVAMPGFEHDVVVGVGGVFLLAVRGRDSERVRLYDRGLWVDGRRTHELADTDRQAAAVSTRLTDECGWHVACEPVIVVLSTDLVVRSRPDDVHVLHAHVLGRWLQHLPSRLTPQHVELVVAAATALGGRVAERREAPAA